MSVYKAQLQQIREALKTCSEDDRTNLIDLESDLKELIALENLENQNKSEADDDESSDDDGSEVSTPLKASHSHLLNQKCRAPFRIKGQLESYHNAFIADIISGESDEEILVKVLFLNPIFNSMKPCKHFLDDLCTYETNCKYSHGEKVVYSQLRPYHDPNFSLLKKRCHVLIKTESLLWKQGIIVEVNVDSKICVVKLHNTGKSFECPFHDILPPIDTESDSSDLSTDEDDFNDEESLSVKKDSPINDTFGSWEKFTRGFGSKILEKLGYIHGDGLGKRNDGILQPVSAKIYLQGKSLDYNMELNEKKARSTVVEKLKRDSLRQQKLSAQNYSQPENTVFNFLNTTICKIRPTEETSSKQFEVKTQSKTQLNLRNFKLEEDIKKLTKTIDKLSESMKRQTSSSDPIAKNIQLQIQSKQNELVELHKKMSEISKEQRMRNEKSKLTVF